MTIGPNSVFYHCSRKRPYRSREHAEAVIARRQAQPGYVTIPGQSLKPYLCDLCYRWHIGNSWEKKEKES